MTDTKEQLDKAVDAGEDLADMRGYQSKSSIYTRCICTHYDVSHDNYGPCRVCADENICDMFYPEEMSVHDDKKETQFKPEDGWVVEAGVMRYESSKDQRKHNHSGGSSSGWKGGSQTVYQSCRHAATQAYSIEKITYCGGSRSKVENVSFAEDWLVVSLLGSWFSSTPKKIITGKNQTFVKELSDFTIDPPKPNTPGLTIDWKDMGAPPLLPGFWTKLHKLVTKSKFTNVLFYCEGGHGRTGTALVSMLVEVSAMVPKEALEYVRKHYCKEAVESNSQKDYINELYKVNHGE